MSTNFVLEMALLTTKSNNNSKTSCQKVGVSTLPTEDKSKRKTPY